MTPQSPLPFPPFAAKVYKSCPLAFVRLPSVQPPQNRPNQTHLLSVYASKRNTSPYPSFTAPVPPSCRFPYTLHLGHTPPSPFSFEVFFSTRIFWPKNPHFHSSPALFPPQSLCPFTLGPLRGPCREPPYQSIPSGGCYFPKSRDSSPPIPSLRVFFRSISAAHWYGIFPSAKRADHHWHF